MAPAKKKRKRPVKGHARCWYCDERGHNTRTCQKRIKDEAAAQALTVLSDELAAKSDGDGDVLSVVASAARAAAEKVKK